MQFKDRIAPSLYEEKGIEDGYQQKRSLQQIIPKNTRKMKLSIYLAYLPVLLATFSLAAPTPDGVEAPILEKRRGCKLSFP